MELSEAKKECRDLIEEYLSCSVIGLDMQVDVGFGEKRCEAIDIVLKALADKNYISKEYREMVVKEQNDIIDDLKSKLDNSISKYEVRNLIEEVSKQGNSKYVEQTYYYKDGIYVDKSGAIKLLKKLLGE